MNVVHAVVDAEPCGPTAGTLVDARELSRLKWRCRRGLLENDLLIERFFARYEASLTQFQARNLHTLMDLADNDLLDLLLARTQPTGDLLQPGLLEVIAMLRPRPVAGSGFLPSTDATPTMALRNS